jgi:protein-disulfide isomerase
MPKEYKILLGIGLGAIVLGVVLFKFFGTPAQLAPLTDRAGLYTKGASTATITLTEFADFQCPACRTANDIPNQVLSNYPNDVKFVFRNFPLTSHPFGTMSALASEAAGAQGKFWEMHDLLYEKQDEWGNLAAPLSPEQVLTYFQSYAGQLGLDVNKFSKAVETNEAINIINEDISAGTASGVNATPTFYVNNTKITEPSFAAIKKEIDRVLQK